MRSPTEDYGSIWYFDGTPGSWTQVPGSARDIGIGAEGDVWIMRADGSIARWNIARNDWDPTNGTGAQISVGPGGTPWGVQDNGMIWYGTPSVPMQ